MILDFWQSIRDFFINIFQKVSWSSIFTLFAGIIIGILISVLVYVILFLKSINKKEKQNEFDENNIKSNEDNELYSLQLEMIKKYIDSTKDEFNEVTEDMTLAQKFDVVKELGTNLAINIAKIYYPDSTHPISELSIDEILQLDYYICNRIEELFDGKILKNLRNVKIAQVLRMIDKKNKIEDNKIIKGAKKLKIGGISTMVKSAINFINPIFWVKKSLTNVTIDIGTNRIVKIIFEIIGEETAKVYSKNAFIINEETKKFEEEIAYLENTENKEGDK